MGEQRFRMSCQSDDHVDVLVQWDERTRRCPLCAIRAAERRSSRRLRAMKDALKGIERRLDDAAQEVRNQKAEFDRRINELTNQVEGYRVLLQTGLPNEKDERLSAFMESLLEGVRKTTKH